MIAKVCDWFWADPSGILAIAFNPKSKKIEILLDKVTWESGKSTLAEFKAIAIRIHELQRQDSFDQCTQRREKANG